MLQPNSDLVPRSPPKPTHSNFYANEFRPSVPEISMVLHSEPSMSMSTKIRKDNLLTTIIAQENCKSDIQDDPAIIPFSKCCYNQNQTPNRCLLEHKNYKFSQKCDVNESESASFSYKYLDRGLNPSTGTQTSGYYECFDNFDIHNFASKKDVEDIKDMIEEVKKDNKFLIETLQKFLQENKPRMVAYSDENITKGTSKCKSPKTAYVLTEKELIKNLNQHNDEKTTTYEHERKPNQLSIFPVSEQSVVMNELAAKYVPNEKINDLLETAVIRREIKSENEDNLYRNTPELSTPSYKYLKKYKLLPEENNNSFAMNGMPSLDQNKEKNLLDLELIRSKPKFL